MPLFIYQAVDSSGKMKSGEVNASDRTAAVALLERDSLTPIRLIPKEKVKKKALSLDLNINFKGVTPIDKILLTKHLASVVKAGLSLHEALDILWDDAKRPIMKQILFDARTNLERGQPLSLVFTMYPKYFSPVFVGLVRAGEKTGTLEDALTNLGDQLIRDYDLVKKIKQAMVYPAILLGMSFLIVILLLTFLLPRLIKVFSASQVKLPAITRAVVFVSNTLAASPILTFLGLLLLLAGFISLIATPRGRMFLINYLERLPMVGTLIRRVVLARLTRTLRNLLRSGVGALETIDITAQTIGNRSYQTALLEIREEVRRGSSLSDSFRIREKLFPRLFVSMVMVGERTGTLENSLKTLTEFYEEEADRTLKTLVGLIEPVMLILMGLVVGGIAISVLLPIYQLVGSLR